MSNRVSSDSRQGGAQRPTKKRRLKTLLLPVSVVILIVAALGFFAFPVSGIVNPAYTIEAGSPLPEASVFSAKDGDPLRFAGGSDRVNTAVPGEYDLTVASGLRRYTCTLIVQDTTPPVALMQPASVWTGGAVSPDDFISAIDDATAVTSAFVTPPDTAAPGAQEVTLLLTDSSGNEARINAALYVYDLPEVKNVALRSADAPLTSFDIIHWFTETPPQDFTMITDISQINPGIPGNYQVSVSLNGEIRECWLRLLDATPPKATGVNATKWLGDAIQPEDFVTNVQCDSEYTLSFANLPDITTSGEYTVTVAVTSAYGAQTQVNARLTVLLDAEPPVISGAVDKFIALGSAAAYRKDITVTDNRDEEIELTVDSSAVNLKAPGTYTVVYSAVDSSGNKATVNGSMTVHEITHEEVVVLAEGILSQIATEDMSQYDTAHAIYKWAKRSISYSNGSDKSSVDYAAYKAFTAGSGDCYTYYAACEVLLNAAGIDNIAIKRIPGTKTQHFWSIVNVGDGWYHFDTTPHKQGGDSFMITQSQAVEHETLRGANYYAYDESLYPEVVP